MQTAHELIDEIKGPFEETEFPLQAENEQALETGNDWQLINSLSAATEKYRCRYCGAEEIYQL